MVVLEEIPHHQNKDMISGCICILSLYFFNLPGSSSIVGPEEIHSIRYSKWKLLFAFGLALWLASIHYAHLIPYIIRDYFAPFQPSFVGFSCSIFKIANGFCTDCFQILCVFYTTSSRERLWDVASVITNEFKTFQLHW